MMISVSLEEWARLEDRAFWLQCLEAAGVDNWGGIDYAYALYNSENPEEED